MTTNNIDIVFLVKKAFKSMINDPSYIILYLFLLLVTIIPTIAMWFLFGDLQNLDYTYVQNQQVITDFLRENLFSILGIILIYIFVYLIVGTIIIGGFIKKVDLQEKNEKMSVKNAISFGLKIFPRFFAAMIVGIVILYGPFILLTLLLVFSALNEIWGVLCLSCLSMLIIGILWIYIGLRLSLYPYACVIDNKGPIDCFKKSWQITKGNVLLIFALYVIMFVICFIFSIPSTIISYLGLPYAVSSVYGMILSVFLFPFFTLTFTLLYLTLSKSHTPRINQYRPNSPSNDVS